MSEDAMTTPTPRTDAAAVNAHDGLPVTRVSADFARQLERDLAAAQEELERVRDKCNEHYMALAAAQEALEQERRYTRSLVSDPLPKSPLRDLGEWLADHLDEDRWKNCEVNFLIPALAYLKEAQERAQRAEERAEANARDAERLDWLIEHGTDEGGGRGFEFRVYIPHDSECLRTAIDAAREGK